MVAQLHRSPNDYISIGYGDAEGNFTLEGTSAISVSGSRIGFSVPSNDGDWRFEFYAPQLEVGRTFDGAVRLMSAGDGPAMQISSPGKTCNRITGEFTIEQATPDMVIIRFTQFCEGNTNEPLSGTVTFRPD